MIYLYITMFIIIVLLGIVVMFMREAHREMLSIRKRLHVLELALPSVVGHLCAFNEWIAQTPNMQDRLSKIEAICKERH